MGLPMRGRILAWLKGLDGGEFILGGAVGFLAAGALFTVVVDDVIDRANNRAIEAAQYRIAEAEAFRQSLHCVAETVVAGCLRWEPKLQ